MSAFEKKAPGQRHRSLIAGNSHRVRGDINPAPVAVNNHDVVFFDPPEVGDAIVAGQSYGELESVKAVSDLIAPLDGEVVEVNAEMVSTPEGVNDDPYQAWLIKVRLSDAAQVESLLDAAAYRQLINA